MDNFFWFIVAVLATERITSIIYREKIATSIRYWLGERVDPYTGKETYPDTFFGKLIACFWCLSVWVGVAVSIIWYIFPYLLIPFALSFIAMWIDEKTINQWLKVE